LLFPFRALAHFVARKWCLLIIIEKEDPSRSFDTSPREVLPPPLMGKSYFFFLVILPQVSFFFPFLISGKEAFPGFYHPLFTVLRVSFSFLRQEDSPSSRFFLKSNAPPLSWSRPCREGNLLFGLRLSRKDFSKKDRALGFVFFFRLIR